MACTDGGWTGSRGQGPYQARRSQAALADRLDIDRDGSNHGPIFVFGRCLARDVVVTGLG